MKTLIPIVLSILILTSCSQQEFAEIAMATGMSEYVELHQTINKEDALMNYVKSNHSQEMSRGAFSELEPIVYRGDTVAYVMNFVDGWEIYSNSLNMPILLMKSETGQFDSNTLEENPAFNAFFELSKQALHKEKNVCTSTSQYYEEEWKVYADSQNKSRNIVSRKPVRKETYNVGMCSYLEKSDTIEHLILTKWNQDYPYNEFCPYVKGTSNTEHALAGCGPIAVAQFLYYAHYNWGRPATCYTVPYYIKDSNTYTFHISSSKIWDEMPLYTFNNTNPALIIGYAGKEMNTTFGTDTVGQGSSTSCKNIISFLNKMAGVSITRKTFVSAEVYDCLENKKPVLSDIYGTIVDPDKRGSIGHVIIFDYCKREQWRLEYYRAELPEDPGYGEFPPHMTREQAEIFYGKIEVSSKPGRTNYYFKANWGWGPFATDPTINGALLEVTSGGYSFDEMYMMIY